MHDAITIGVPLIAIIAGILFNRSDSRDIRAEVSSARKELHQEISGIRVEMQSEFREFYRTMGQHDAQRCIVADGTEIADVVRQSLQLCHDTAQRDGAWRRFDAQGIFDGARKGEGISHGAVAGNAAHARSRAASRAASAQVELA